MASVPKPGFRLVVTREWRWMLRDRVMPILVLGVPLLAVIVLTAVFSHQVMRGLGVVVVDDDRTPTAATFIESVAASPTLAIVARPADLSAAARAIRSGEAGAAVYIPANFERDLQAGRRPQVTAFYNQQALTAAGVASQGLSDALHAAASHVAAAGHSAPSRHRIGTLAVEQIALTNPERNYAQYLVRALLPVVLHIVVAISAGYAVGSEFRRRSLRAWLACAGGNPITALAGKLTPLFILFIGMMGVLTLVIEGVFGIPFRGDLPMMLVAALLFLIAYLALGALLQLVTRELATGLALTGLIVSPAFGFAGVGFPVIGMNSFAQYFGALLPLRWYMSMLFGQAACGLPVQASAQPFAALACLAALFVILAVWRLHAIQPTARSARTLERGPEDPALPQRDFGGVFATEWRRVLSNRSVFSTLMLAPLIYGIYYPQPYLTQILHEVPVAVVDNDLTHLSQDIVQALDASGTVRVAVRAQTLEEARAALQRGKVFAILGIPPGTERDVLKGDIAHLPFYADATYLLIFKATAAGVASAVATLSADLTSLGARSEGSLAKASLASASPADILIQPIFNPTGGYASYIVPAAFVLIIQQTLLMGVAMLTVGGLAAYRPLPTVIGRAVAHLTLSLPALALFLVVLPRVYGFSTLGQTPALFALAAPFILATSFLGQAAGAWFKQRETAVLLFLATSIPQLFVVGFAWPREAIPAPVLTASRIFPSDFAIDGLLRVNQMGADLNEVWPDWRGLWLMTLVYFILAWLSARWLQGRRTYG
ncbi:ABC transporter permease [Bradyrhizobium sp. HKCCYLS1011]|uniref:ABC transporter permease n=1 Tax=Bradyrhizobium sp. HKCCYLS1011 TaxID=3420733 RepID=UPI003EBC57A4